MKILIDSADLGEIERTAELGLLDGCTTTRACWSRRVDGVKQAALAASRCGTMPLKVLEELVHHPLTDVGLAKSLEDDVRAAAKGR